MKEFGQITFGVIAAVIALSVTMLVILRLFLFLAGA